MMTVPYDDWPAFISARAPLQDSHDADEGGDWFGWDIRRTCIVFYGAGNPANEKKGAR
jgi:hypothetical protein